MIVDKSRLQRVVADSEFEQEEMSFGDLCEAVASNKYAMSMGLDSSTAGAIIIEYGTITKCDKPDSWPPAEEEDSGTVDEQVTPLEPEPEPQPVAETVVAEPKVIQIFDEGGRGRKGCPSCKKFVGVRHKFCACGHDFKNGTAKVAKPAEPANVEPKVIQTFDEGGRGRKGCPSCKKFVGARHKFCACGHDFKNGTAVKVDKPVEPKIIKTFDEGGQGRKECPSCHKFVSVCYKVCACDHTFEKKQRIETFDEGGEGLKECPECNKFVGSRYRSCACGHEFVRTGGNIDRPEAAAVDVLAQQKGALIFEGRLKYVSTPAGECPCKLESTDQEAVEEWADRVRAKGMEIEKFYMVSALAYYAREFYDLTGDEHPVVDGHLRTYFADELAA